jgi:ABC-2 type transport system permease protein
MIIAGGNDERTGVARASRAFLARDLGVALSYPIPFALQFAAILFSVFAYSFVAELVPPDEVPGGYFTFVVIGLMTTSLLDAGVSVLGSNLRTEQVQGTLEAILASGLPTLPLAVGMASFPMASAAASAGVYVIVGGVLGASAPDATWSLALAALVVGSIGFVGIGLVGAFFVLWLRRATTAIAWIVALMTLAAGELFPPELLPSWIRGPAALSPFTQCLVVVRAALLEGATWTEEWARMAVLVGTSCISLLLGMMALDRGLRLARRKGVLGGY